MKNALRHLTGLLLLSLCFLAWAKSTPTDQTTLAVQIHGINKNLQKSLNTSINHRRKLALHLGNTAAINNFYEGIPKLIQESISPEGYFEPNIQSKVTHQGKTWQGNFTVDLGPRVSITQINVSVIGAGHNDSAFLRLQENFPIKIGQPFSAKQYNSAKSAFFDIASARGYFEAKMISSKASIDLSRHTAHISFYFNSGPRYQFGETTFGTSPFKNSFLQRYLDYQPGDYYDIEKIQSSRDGLTGSDYFEQVIMTPETSDTTHRITPLTVNLSTQKPREYTYGAGFGTDTGIRALIGTRYRWVDASGDSVNTWLRFSQVNSSLSADYVIPGSHPATDRYIITGALQDFDQITGSGKSAKISAQYQTVIASWQQTASLTYLRERYQLTDYPKTNADILYPSIAWQKKYSNNLINPDFGFNFSFSSAIANDSLFSETSFWRIGGNGKILFTPFDNTRIVLRTTVAYIDVSNLESIPLSLQLFAGGAQSIRGYGYDSIGPGRELFSGSFEIQHRIVNSYYAVAFIDAGNVSDNIFKEKLHVGTGPGFAWLSPIGIFEITLANAVSQPNHPWAIQFIMGAVI